VLKLFQCFGVPVVTTFKVSEAERGSNLKYKSCNGSEVEGVSFGAIHWEGALSLRRKFGVKEVRYQILLRFVVLTAEIIKTIHRVLCKKVIKKSSVSGI
jgi:hypothetical protein